jgi:hypothetical protein
MRRVLPAVGLFFLAPLVAEFLLGNLPITALPALVILAPLYGGGALLIRELARRTGHGWPTIIVLALAYGVLEEGVTTMSLFNPNYAGQRLLDYGYIPALGIGGPWTLYVLLLHTVWSISVPIALVEVLAHSRRTTPWLGRTGLAVTSVLFILGVVATTATSIFTSPTQYVASPIQLAASVVVVLLLAGVALRLPRADTAHTAAAAPSPWLLGLAALLVTSAFGDAPGQRGSLALRSGGRGSGRRYRDRSGHAGPTRGLGRCAATGACRRRAAHLCLERVSRNPRATGQPVG